MADTALSASRADFPISILFIDGNDQERSYFVHELKARSSNYKVFEATSGKVGLDLCENHPFDCVILELGLPDMSGFEILGRLVPDIEHPRVPIVVLTRLAPVLLDVVRQNGAVEGLSKSRTSGAMLDQAIRKAIATVGRVPKDKKGL